MGTKYTTVLSGGVVSTYSDGSPADDGSKTAANKVKFATIESDLTAPLHSAIVKMDTRILEELDWSAEAKSGNYTCVAADHGKTMLCDGTFTVTLTAAGTVGTGYFVTIVNVGSGTITVDPASGTINGESNIAVGGNYRSVTCYTDSGPTNYVGVVSASSATAEGGFSTGTKMAFHNDSPPTGWTKLTSAGYSNTVFGSTTGPVGTGGSTNFTDIFKNGFQSEAWALTISQIPNHNHQIWGTRNSAATGANKDCVDGAVVGSSDSLTPTGNRGGGGSHYHEIDLNVKYVTFIVASAQ